jgi:hypothetical protein
MVCGPSPPNPSRQLACALTTFLHPQPHPGRQARAYHARRRHDGHLAAPHARRGDRRGQRRAGRRGWHPPRTGAGVGFDGGRGWLGGGGGLAVALGLAPLAVRTCADSRLPRASAGLQETLRGTFPIDSVQTVCSIARQAEKVRAAAGGSLAVPHWRHTGVTHVLTHAPRHLLAFCT